MKHPFFRNISNERFPAIAVGSSNAAMNHVWAVSKRTRDAESAETEWGLLSPLEKEIHDFSKRNGFKTYRD